MPYVGKEESMFAALTSKLAKTAIGASVGAAVVAASATYRIKKANAKKGDEGQTLLQYAAQGVGKAAKAVSVVPKTISRGIGAVSKQCKDGLQEGYAK